MSPLFPNIQSDLDLNGPILSFSSQPVGTSCSVASGIATFIGIATATFPSGQTERETNTGEISYQWYKGSTALTDGTNVTGSAKFKKLITSGNFEEAVSVAKDQIGARSAYFFDYLSLLDFYAYGSIQTLAKKITFDNSMLYYLDKFSFEK